MTESKPLAISGKVIWTTPPRSDSYRPSGIGIQFCNNDNGNVRDKIETYLAGALMSDRSTFTM
jgi:type IV pilus assembly protein PilZ